MEECETTVDALAVSDKSKQVHSALPRLKYTSANFELIKNMQYIRTYICKYVDCVNVNVRGYICTYILTYIHARAAEKHSYTLREFF